MASKHHQDDELLSLQSPVALDVRQDICWSGEECNADDSEVDELLSRGDGCPGRPRDNCLVTEVTHWHHLLLSGGPEAKEGSGSSAGQHLGVKMSFRIFRIRGWSNFFDKNSNYKNKIQWCPTELRISYRNERHQLATILPLLPLFLVEKKAAR